MRGRLNAIFVTGVISLLPSAAFAQKLIPDLSTQAGHEVNAGLGYYNYVEPNGLSISIHGIKFGGEYTGTFVLSRRSHWYAQANARIAGGHVTYDGWCSPFIITPEPSSPNGYFLDIGDASACSESGDSDWYFETRGLVGKDFIGRSIAWSPYFGVGFRHISNGTTGTPGYRTDKYLYVPLGLTARLRVVSFNVEFDPLIHGWQTTHDSALGGGDIPATDTAPAFTIDGFTDVSFDQHSGWALRVSAKYFFTRHISLEPYYIHWSIADSPVSTQIATFTVNGITAQEQFGAYEPHNTTNEFGVKLGFRF